MNKKIIKLNESKLQNIVKETIQSLLNENQEQYLMKLAQMELDAAVDKCIQILPKNTQQIMWNLATKNKEDFCRAFANKLYHAYDPQFDRTPGTPKQKQQPGNPNKYPFKY